MKIEKAYSNNVLYIDKKLRVELKKGNLIFIKDSKTERILRINSSRLLNFVSKFTFFERLLRLEPRALLNYEGKCYLLSYGGNLYKVLLESGSLQNIFKYASGTKNPLHFCIYERKEKTEIVFGDYGGHDINGNAGIYRVTFDELTNNFLILQIADIDGKVINHIHRVEYDNFRDCYWIFTGDTDEGSGIWKLGYDQKKPDPFLLGKQIYRACVAYVNKDSILYATDSPAEKNYIYTLDISSKELKMLANLPGSCIFGIRPCFEKDLYCFATTVEPDSDLPKIRYRFTYRIGKGIQDRYCHIFIGSLKNGFKEIWSAKKDIYPIWLFQFGNVKFPTQSNSEKIFFCPQGLCGKRGTYVIQK